MPAIARIAAGPVVTRGELVTTARRMCPVCVIHGDRSPWMSRVDRRKITKSLRGGKDSGRSGGRAVGLRSLPQEAPNQEEHVVTRIRKRLSYANVVASLALFIALGGVSYAAVAGKNTVISSSIKNGQVRSVDLANNAVTAAKIRDGHVGSAEIADGAVAGADLAAGVAGVRAHASVAGDGAVTLAKGVTDVFHAGVGQYCVNFAPSAGVSNASLVLPLKNTLQGDPTVRFEVRWETTPNICPAGRATIIVFDATTFFAEDHSFFLLVP
jgi:hypothetical protein